jgi:hypothetical protein
MASLHATRILVAGARWSGQDILFRHDALRYDLDHDFEVYIILLV